MLRKVSLVVLHRYAYSDSSWIVKALSPGLGVLSLLVKGGKSKDSPFKGALDPLACSEVVIHFHPHRELLIPREASLRKWFPALRSRLDDLAVAQVMAEILLRLAQSGGPSEEEFHSLVQVLDSLEQGDARPDLLAHWLFHLGELLGYAFSLEFCVQCGNVLQPVPADVWPAQGGGVCPACLGVRRAAYSSEFIGEITSFMRFPEQVPAEVAIRRLELFFLNYLKVHTGSLDTLRSWQWLCDLRESIPRH